MKNLKIGFILIIICGCSASLLKHGYYHVTFISNSLFENYILIQVKDNQRNYVIISQYVTDTSGLKEIKKGDILELELQKADTVFTTKFVQFQRSKGQINEFWLGNELIWKNDTIKTTVYTSPNIFGKFYRPSKN